MARKKSEEMDAESALPEQTGDTATATATVPANGDSTPKPKAPPKPKDVRFREQANRRLPKLDYAAKRVAMLANKASYSMTDAQRQKVLELAEASFNRILNAFGINTADASMGENLF